MGSEKKASKKHDQPSPPSESPPPGSRRETFRRTSSRSTTRLQDGNRKDGFQPNQGSIGLESEKIHQKLNSRSTNQHNKSSQVPRSHHSETKDTSRLDHDHLSEITEEPEIGKSVEVRSELERNQIGDMNRTLIEGMVMKTGFESLKSKTARMFSRTSNSGTTKRSSKEDRIPSIRPPPSPSPPPSKDSQKPERTKSERVRAASARPATARPSSARPLGVRAPSAGPLPTSASQKARSKQIPKPQKSTPKQSSKPGMIGLTRYENQSMIPATYPAITTAPSPSKKSRAPSTVKSIFRDAKDAEMGARQTMINTLSPDERKEQEKWAMNHLKLTAACPDAFTWNRINEGYHCNGEHHLITDELLAEGKGGVYLIGGDIESERWGPYYASNEKTEGLLWYAGVEPRPGAATEYIGETDERGKKWLRENGYPKSVERRGSSTGQSRYDSRGIEEMPFMAGGIYDPPGFPRRSQRTHYSSRHGSSRSGGSRRSGGAFLDHDFVGGMSGRRR